MKLFLASVFSVMLTTFVLGGPAFADTPVVPVPAPVVTSETGFTAVSLDSSLPGTGYFGVGVGSGFQSSDTNRRGDASFYSATYGRDLGLYNLEVEGFRSSTSGSTWVGNVDVWGLMLNGKAKYKNTTKFTPFVQLGGGVGLFDDCGVRDNGLHLLVQGGAGVSYALTDTTNVELGYNRMWSPADVRQNNGSYDNFQEDVMTLGVNFKY